LAEGAIPSPPTTCAASSDRISPYTFMVSRTSNESGSLTIAMAAASTYISLYETPGWDEATSLATRLKRPSVFCMTLDLWTIVTCLLRLSASLNAYSAILLEARSVTTLSATAAPGSSNSYPL